MGTNGHGDETVRSDRVPDRPQRPPDEREAAARDDDARADQRDIDIQTGLTRAELSHERADEREHGLDLREWAADNRDRRADRREAAADERELRADHRDDVADERDRLADLRDKAADQREIDAQLAADWPTT